ncbi:hypothetical protein HPB49_016709 [Dermacentor silvarum]|uniref:Uncharacterized protein n=1 Tax=Dermacentor silvarum TaxID=543639 RepID=A0ACB8DJR9_DERSI|nr:hypothetical protein HPB49_016709 [Dermacentor silvarum]
MSALSKLKRTVRSVTSLINGIVRSREGMTETDTMKLVQAFVISRITYALPSQAARQTDIDQANRLRRIACKAALSLPENMSTDRLSELGMMNTYEELAAVTLMAQRERLNATP